MSHKLVLCVLGVWCGSATVCRGQEAGRFVLSLAQCEQLELGNSVQVQQANRSLELARLRHAQASHARFVPQLVLRNFWSAVPRARGEIAADGSLISPDTMVGIGDLRPFTEVTLDVIQPLWTFGRLRGLRDAAAFGVEAGQADVTSKEADVLLQVRELYWGLVLGKEIGRAHV